MNRPDPQDRLDAIARLLQPCPEPDRSGGWDLCAHAAPWPCPATEASWIARGLDPGPAPAILSRLMNGGP